MPQVKCPRCGNRHLQVVVTQLADVEFDEGGDHEVSDVYGDVEFSSESDVICATNHGGCGHASDARQNFIDDMRALEDITPDDVQQGGEEVNVYITHVLRSEAEIRSA